MSCVVQWWDVLFVKGMHFSSKNARLLNLQLLSSLRLFQTFLSLDYHIDYAVWPMLKQLAEWSFVLPEFHS